MNNYEIRFYESIDSTNSEALRKMSELGPKTIFHAKTQTTGRGQRGNRWTSQPGENLTFSIALRFGGSFLSPLAASCQYVLNQAIALGVVDYLESLDINAKIKWPNDIYVGDKKICGILIENSLSGTNLKHSIIGIGLNLNQKLFPSDVPNPSSVTLETGKNIDTKEALKNIMPFIDARITSIEDIKIKDDYLSRLYRIKEVHRYRDEIKSIIFEGQISGITDDFKLIVEDTNSNLKEFAFKEISYII